MKSPVNSPVKSSGKMTQPGRRTTRAAWPTILPSIPGARRASRNAAQGAEFFFGAEDNGI